MAVLSTLSILPSTRTIIDNTLLSPFITGALLFYIKRNPSALDKLPWFPDLTLTLPFRLPLNIRNSVTLHASPPLKTLKFLFGLGLVLYVNRFLNRLALNYWHLQKQGVPWDFQAEGKETILITGGCSGFGREMVQMFAEQTRANILVLDIQDLPADMKDISRLTYYQTDLTSPSSITSTITTILNTSHPPPTVLINNAGIAQAHTILNTTDAYLEKIFRVNVLSHFTLIRLLLPVMMSQRKGHIVSLASMASYVGVASLVDYSATKAAVLGMHEGLVQELAHRYADHGGHCIQASIVHPIWARTPLIGSWEKELNKSGQHVLTARDVAGGAVRQVLSGRSGSVFFPQWMWMGTLLRFLPDWVALTQRATLHPATQTAEKDVAGQHTK
ncbi:uncharacterized protein Z518_01819 [Rhinocladiella mackenziei CBS 650.93]|uniref:Rhinocladiella mackenziei CBS 650.93 unplaced genomic scaffold supercont1.2, whole genome shotgun sequence n=1 Tax=Rhinocladiella mackenziei CBS 650.93 TaxID=1442369 RepID=A0A0D2IVE5_9EURO|nr:uncharacterized protein Z518_01819 [Rhinocladiella mackenziei CBS 650.93]KIX07166.1 hypothetical protein Z518_01819 [Rhinocladiella mackenziei CBS 650.93]